MRSSPGSLTFESDSWLSLRFLPEEWAPKPISYPRDNHPTTTSVCISCQTDHSRSFRAPQMCRGIDDSSTSGVYKARPGPMKKVTAMVETPGSDLSWFLNVLKPTYAVYLPALGSAHLIRLDKQGPWQSTACTVREPLGLPEQHLLGNYHTLGTRIFI